MNERDSEKNVEPSDRPMVRRNGAFRVKVEDFFALRIERRERAQNFAATARRQNRFRRQTGERTGDFDAFERAARFEVDETEGRPGVRVGSGFGGDFC